MSRKYIIDGYNLIYQIPELRRELEYDLETAREGLVRRLEVFAAKKKVQVVLVYDGDKRIPDLEPQENSLCIVYSKFPDKADLLIKKMVDAEKDRNHVVVVSSDREIMDYVKLSRIKAVSAQVFASEMNDRADRDIEKKFDKSMDSEELEEWLRLFQKGSRDKDVS